MSTLVASFMRAYLSRFPIEKGKWRAWSLLYPHLRRVAFTPGPYALKHGIAMHLDPEQYIDQHCFYWGTWEPDETKVVLHLLRPGDTFVDVGANIGYFTLLAAKLVGPQGRVYAFEPVPPTLERLKRNIDLSGTSNVTICACAASSAGGHTRVSQRGVGEVSGQNTMRPGSAHQQHWDVSTARIDDVIPGEETIRLMKLDVEGAELLALEGAMQHLCARDGPFLLCEVTEEYLRELGGSAAKLWSLVQGLGYNYVYDCHRGRLKPIIPGVLESERQLNVLITKAPLTF